MKLSTYTFITRLWWSVCIGGNCGFAAMWFAQGHWFAGGFNGGMAIVSIVGLVQTL